MINSMTGYGQAKGQLDGVTYVAEIKTVNNRYFKTSIRLPESIGFLEEEIDKLLRKNLSRGMVNCALRLETSAEQSIDPDTCFKINEKALRQLMEKLNKIGSSANCTVDVGSLLTLPGIIMPQSPDAGTIEKIKTQVLETTAHAIEQLKQTRGTEGAALAKDIGNCCKTISEDLEKIKDRCDVVLQQYHEKLKQRVERLLSQAKLKLDEETLAREVAVFAERSDISEELTRLDSHLVQFAQACETDSAAGRRLDFISQEMLREANTIASKSNDSLTAQLVVDIKCQIDRIKEQVQNIE